MSQAILRNSTQILNECSWPCKLWRKRAPLLFYLQYIYMRRYFLVGFWMYLSIRESILKVKIWRRHFSNQAKMQFVRCAVHDGERILYQHPLLCPDVELTLRYTVRWLTCVYFQVLLKLQREADLHFGQLHVLTAYQVMQAFPCRFRFFSLPLRIIFFIAPLVLSSSTVGAQEWALTVNYF